MQPFCVLSDTWNGGLQLVRFFCLVTSQSNEFFSLQLWNSLRACKARRQTYFFFSFSGVSFDSHHFPLFFFLAAFPSGLAAGYIGNTRRKKPTTRLFSRGPLRTGQTGAPARLHCQNKGMWIKVFIYTDQGQGSYLLVILCRRMINRYLITYFINHSGIISLFHLETTFYYHDFQRLIDIRKYLLSNDTLNELDIFSLFFQFSIYWIRMKRWNIFPRSLIPVIFSELHLFVFLLPLNLLIFHHEIVGNSQEWYFFFLDTCLFSFFLKIWILNF